LPLDLLFFKQEFLRFAGEAGFDALGDQGEELGQVELELDGVGEDVEAAGDFLAERVGFEAEAVVLPMLLEGNHAADAAGHLLANAAEALVDAAAGFFLAEVVRDIDGNGAGHGGIIRRKRRAASGEE
jgi:hypothetical protein